MILRACRLGKSVFATFEYSGRMSGCDSCTVHRQGGYSC